FWSASWMRYTRDYFTIFFFSSRRRHTRFSRDWSSDVCSSDLSPRTRPRSAGPDLLVGVAEPADRGRVRGEAVLLEHGQALGVAEHGRGSCRAKEARRLDAGSRNRQTKASSTV